MKRMKQKKYNYCAHCGYSSASRQMSSVYLTQLPPRPPPNPDVLKLPGRGRGLGRDGDLGGGGRGAGREGGPCGGGGLEESPGGGLDG